MTPGTAENRREAARVIEQAQPGWMVIYGIYSKQYVAFPLFHAPAGTILTAAYPPALIDRMQRTEDRISGRSAPCADSRPAPVPSHAPAPRARAGSPRPARWGVTQWQPSG